MKQTHQVRVTPPTVRATSMPDLETIQVKWTVSWPSALAAWSRFTRLSEPRWCRTAEQAKAEGLGSSFAMIRLDDQTVVIDLAMVREKGLDDYPVEILAHEVGHHVYAPGDLADQGRMIARMRRALPTKEGLAGMISNLYTDLLINDRLQRSAGLRMGDVYKTLRTPGDRLWTLYMRIYEILWAFPKGTLAEGPMDDPMEGDAQLGARLVRTFARDWLEGAGRFAALCLPYLLENDGQETREILRGWLDVVPNGKGDVPHGLTGIDAGELDGAVHPAQDPILSGLPGDGKKPQRADGQARGGQHREPFEYGAILKALGLNLGDHENAVRYYRERALPHLIPYPVRVMPESSEPQAEGLEPWDIGSPLEEAEWMESVFLSPRVVPGLTTLRRVWGTSPGSLPEREPLDLDLYVDCSGSMPNPQVNVSYLTLAGAIVALSALRAGARVQATLWSGANEFETTGGFVRDERRILQILTGYLGGSTAFPIHMLRDTYADRKPTVRSAHILVISDEGVTTMFAQDERGNSGWDIAKMALGKARGGGTLALNIGSDWGKNPDLARANAEGWTIHAVRTWEELVDFARAFSRARYDRTQVAQMGR